jgi:hypothetical protein
MPYISGLTADTTPDVNADYLVVEKTAGTRKMLMKDALGIMENAGYHNSIYRGKSLGTALSSAQAAAIANGKFTDMFIGDYWTINSKVYRIADFMYWYNHGDTAFTTPHICVVSDSLGTARMEATNTTANGYVGSEMFTDNLSQFQTMVETAFGSAHVGTHRSYLCNAATDGKATGFAWTDHSVGLMNEPMVYGSYIRSEPYVTDDVKQLALFRLSDQQLNERVWFWLRDPVSSTSFARVDGGGTASVTYASDSNNVRVAFPLI